ncbi:putative sodium-dependent transporter [Phocaeicola salanitronis DSM 18170]|uniref:Putative sodium-dependent transporter n=2 Tax=Phocaeicola salanitronis TaxID=376805 RepID=F0R2F3_PHOSB|nr:putative sodium-dependent transporter [Phocaeicola salanitronis DSM 18170]
MLDMKEKIIRFFKMWTLPLGMFAGVGVYLMFHYITWLSPLKVLAGGAEDYILPTMVFIQLFTTFCKVNPREMRLKRWHVVMLAVQLTCCLTVALPIHFFPHFEYNVVAQGALVCLIVPTGTAAAVIAGRLGGNETTLTTYTILSNLVAAAMIPAVFPLVEMQSAGSFGQQFLLILRRVFPLLLTPFFAAWALREFLPKLHVLVVKWCGSLAFYLWGVSLVIAIGLTLRSVVNSHFDPHVMWLLALSALVACAWQFGIGKLVGKHCNDYISCGQGFGQKNTILAIWVSYTYLTPVISVAPSCYIVWQNIVNSWQLWQKGRRDAR